MNVSVASRTALPRRRDLLALSAGCAAFAILHPAVAAQREFAALRQPALKTSKLAGAAMLASAKAGRRLVCVGERGLVIYSDDGGATWQQADVPVSVTLTAVQFVTESLGNLKRPPPV